ncbi:MAG: hypothetical protein FWG10_06320 [Eubacteriaceae bacterium]|nr:hypothetical protein [Eubacteriaceae bacterium]
MAVLEYKCPNCGSAITFDSTTQKMSCPYCRTEIDTQVLAQYDEELNTPLSDTFGWDWENTSESQAFGSSELDGFSAYSCPSCGGEIVGDKNTIATSCPYCTNPAIITSKVSGMLKPDYVIPFKLDREYAVNAFKEHIKNKSLLPKYFKDENRIDSLVGIYVPFWLFDCDASMYARYRATRTRSWSDSRNNYTVTEHYRLLRQASASFDKVPVDGSVKMDDAYMEAIEPFEYKDLVGFSTAYLSGYFADKYDIGYESSKNRANDRIRQSSASMLLSTTGNYGTIQAEASSVKFSDGKVHYALLPVWMLNIKYNDKIYTFAMNGQTGRFIGELPISWKAFWIQLLAYGAGIGALLSAISLFF